jgi:hypothetical protein
MLENLRVALNLGALPQYRYGIVVVAAVFIFIFVDNFVHYDIVVDFGNAMALFRTSGK